MASSVLTFLASALADFAALPWLEEAVIIATIGVACVLTHQLGVAPALRPAKGSKLAASEEEDNCRDGRARSRPTRRVREPGFRVETGRSRAPPSSRDLPGVTDRRFAGHIVSYREEEGYGFISCPELYPRFNRDVFLHRLQIGGFHVGAPVSFGVFLNKNGQPQARDLETPAPLLMTPSEWGDESLRAFHFDPVPRQPLNPRAAPLKTTIGGASDRAMGAPRPLETVAFELQ
uniref:CSD domain-containing protein n=1 Tax=Alexandrium catenella TaxID=2925 RepID=A0A7S1RK65_ALECA